MVFVAARPKLSVIANQSADWCGNPPVERNQVTITTKNRRNPQFLVAYRYISPLTGGLPRHSSALARNDSKYSTNTNLGYRLSAATRQIVV